MTIMNNLFPCTIASHFGNTLFCIRDQQSVLTFSANRQFTHLRLLQKIGNGLAYIPTTLKRFVSRLLPNKKGKTVSELELPYENDNLYPPVLVHGIDTGEYYGWPGDPLNIWVLNGAETAIVHVSIMDGDGELIEEGEAMLGEDEENWVYNTRAVNSALVGTTIVASCITPSENTSAFATTLS